jgi:hypothetical protein
MSHAFQIVSEPGGLSSVSRCIRAGAVNITAAIGVLVTGPAPAGTPSDRATDTTIVLQAQHDNTLFEDFTGQTAGGAGDGIYSGHTGTSGVGMHRGLIQFDLSSIPPHSTITSVQLTLTLVRAKGGTQTHTLNRMLADWGEGATIAYGGGGAQALPGDATWLHRYYPGTPWSNPGAGGDFVTTASASRTVTNSLVPYTWGSTAGLVADVQGWLNNPATNFGWMIRGNEVTLGTAKKFASREYATPSARPFVTIVYTPPPPCPADRFPQPFGNGVVDMDDLLYIINNWGATGPPGTVPPDITGDGVVNIDDLLAVINGWGACP